MLIGPRLFHANIIDQASDLEHIHDFGTDIPNFHFPLIFHDLQRHQQDAQPGAEPDTLLQNMQTAIGRFVGDAPQFDDLTMLCVKYISSKEELP